MNGANIFGEKFGRPWCKAGFRLSGGCVFTYFSCAGRNSSIDVIVNANEQSCAFAAAGVYRAGDRVGVAIVTSGPAITNTLTVVADSNADSIPLLVFAGQVPSGKMETDEFQHIDVRRVFAKAAKKVILVAETCKIDEIVKDASFFAKSGKPRPVVIDFPMDVQVSKSDHAGIDSEVYRKKYEDERHLVIN